jgi:hypothetical protein
MGESRFEAMHSSAIEQIVERLVAVALRRARARFRAGESLHAMQTAGGTDGGPVQYDHSSAAAAIAQRELIPACQGRDQKYRVLEADAV